MNNRRILAISSNNLERTAKMFNALGDPNRLKLLIHLRQNEFCVNKLAQLENAKIGTISARLKILFEANLVKKRRRQKCICYSLADEHITLLLDNILIHSSECIHTINKDHNNE